MSKPEQRFKVGSPVTHLGNEDGSFIGDKFTILKFYRVPLSVKGEDTGQVAWVYNLESVAHPGKSVHAHPHWLIPDDVKSDGTTWKDMMADLDWIMFKTNKPPKKLT